MNFSDDFDNFSVDNNDTKTTSSPMENFPHELFDNKQLCHGAFLLHILGGVYACYALYAVCYKYFVPAVHIIVQKLGLSNDIAGATVLAFGSSLPGLFTTIIGTFVTKDDLGLGNIIGSNMFNLYAVIGISGIVIKKEIPMERWPVTRDSTFFIISLIMLAGYLCDRRIYWYEALTSILVYGIYIVILCYDNKLRSIVDKVLDSLQTICKRSKITSSNTKPEMMQTSTKDSAVVISEESFENPVKISEQNQKNDPQENKDEQNATEIMIKQLPQNTKTIADATTTTIITSKKRWWFTLPDNKFKLIIWWMVVPVTLLYYITIPDCTKSTWRKFYIVTFTISLVYTGGLTYFISWMVTVIGKCSTFAIPDDVMGYTLLSIGTSMPDLFCSVCVARQGYANMAFSNALGSNIIDVLINLSLPWLLYSTLNADRGYVDINGYNIKFIVGFMVFSVIVMMFVLALCQYKLNKKTGCIALSLYIAFLVAATLYGLLDE